MQAHKPGDNQAKGGYRNIDPKVGEKTQWKKGQSGNPIGLNKGSKHISTYIQELMEDETFTAKYVEGYDLKETKGPPLKAIVRVAAIKAIAGDRNWADWIAKYGWSQKIETEHSGEQKLIIEKRNYKG